MQTAEQLQQRQTWLMAIGVLVHMLTCTGSVDSIGYGTPLVHSTVDSRGWLNTGGTGDQVFQ